MSGTAREFTRQDCRFGPAGRRYSYARLARDYRCADCEGALSEKWSKELAAQGDQGPAPTGWHIACARCGSHCFVHTATLEREAHQAAQALAGLQEAAADNPALADWLDADAEPRPISRPDLYGRDAEEV